MQPTAPPDDLWADLDAGVPIAMLPVRLETRFGTRPAELPDGTSVPVGVLRVRIYPDDISVLPATEGLWQAERAAGAGFWAAQTQDPDEDAATFAHRKVAAWDVLVRQVGAHRATFVAQQTRDGAQQAAGREDRAPAAHLLPDAWVLVGQRGSVREFVHFIPRVGGDPQTGPTRDTSRDAFTQDDALLVSPEDGMRWLTDFPAALSIGMAAEIDLETPEQAQAQAHPAVLTDGLSALYVVGVRSPAVQHGPDSEAVELADVLTRHAAVDKLALAAQGTPTNNLTDRPSGWSSAADPYAAYRRVVDPASAPAAFDPGVPVLHGGATDGVILDAALGTAGVTIGVEGADRHEQWLARNMALLVFPVTLGEVLTELGQHVIYDEQRYETQLSEIMPWAREHVASYLRGRGPLPALRVGRNPYGVLPVMARAGWVRQGEENPFSTQLRELLETLRWYFERAARTAPRLTGGGRPEDELAAVLSLSPVPHAGGYRVRKVTGPVLGANMQAFTLAGTLGTVQEVARQAAQSPQLVTGVQIAAIRRLLALTLNDLVDGTQFERMRLFDAKPMRSWVAHTSKPGRGPADYLNRLLGTPLFHILDLDPPDDLLYVLAEHALAMAGERDMFRLTKLLNADRFQAAVTQPVEFASSGTPTAASRGEMFTQSIGLLAADAQQVPAGLAGARLTEVVADNSSRDALLAALGFDDHTRPVNAYEGTFRAVQALAHGGDELDDDGYTRLTGEALACVSTRIDAWYTSLAMQRLDTLRSRRPTGIHIGAWGVLIDVHPQPRQPVETPNGMARWRQHLADHNATPTPVIQPRDHVGYLHAPSLQQAITAGILRAGELAHRGENTTVASVDLTSKRARTALDLLSAMSHGQPLGALLGYRLERSLHNAGLHTVVSVLRAAYPQRRLTGAPGAPVESGTDTVVPAEVLDGLDVWLNRKQVVAQLGLPPAAEPILGELDLAVEAVADMLVADGVHQLASGRRESAGATFAAVAEGMQPPSVTVANEPRSGVTITHTVVLALDSSSGTSGWDRTAPRAALAPEAERWAESVLGAAGGLTVEAAGQQVTLDTLGLCAIDVVVESRPRPDGQAELAARCTAPAALVELARTVADVLGSSRPVVPADLDSQHSENPTIDAGTVAAVAPPSAARLTPVADAISAGLRTLAAAISAVAAAVDGALPGTTVDGGVLRPLARLGVPGAVQPDGAVDAAVVAAAGSAAEGIRRDVFRLIQQGQPNSATTPGSSPAPPPPAASTASVTDDTWEAMLAAVTGSTTGIETLAKITRRMGGDAVVPTIECDSALATAVVDGVPQTDVQSWLSRTSRVRRPLMHFDDLCLFLEAAGQPVPSLTPCHLPPTPDPGWLGGNLPEASAPANEHRRWKRPKSPHTHVVVAGPTALVTAPTLRGLVVDAVSEVLPAPSVTTGLALHYEAPNARAPQSILLAVHPNPADVWSWPLLQDTAAEALALAELRGVDVDDLVPTGIEEFLPLTYLRDGMDGTTPVAVLTDRPKWITDVIKANRLSGVRF